MPVPEHIEEGSLASWHTQFLRLAEDESGLRNDIICIDEGGSPGDGAHGLAYTGDDDVDWRMWGIAANDYDYALNSYVEVIHSANGTGGLVYYKAWYVYTANGLLVPGQPVYVDGAVHVESLGDSTNNVWAGWFIKPENSEALVMTASGYIYVGFGLGSSLPQSA